MGVEDQLIDSFASEDDRFIDLFSPDRMKELFGTFKEAWQDSAKREEYEILKTDLSEKYMVEPAKYVGFIEESPEMHKDVISAADETGVDPAFLYNVAMQEGIAEDMSEKATYMTDMKESLEKGWITQESFNERAKKNILYSSDEKIHTIRGIGLDALWREQDNLVSKGYLKEEIETELIPGRMHAPKSFGADIKVKDAWRATGALIRQNEYYLTHYFKKEGIDFSDLPDDLQKQWTYASFNAGIGEALKLYKKYGINMFSNEDAEPAVMNAFKSDLKNQSGDFSQWMENVGRVAGGTELTKMYSPFSNRLYE